MASVDIMDLARLARVYVQAERQGMPSAPLLRARYDLMRKALGAGHVFTDDPSDPYTDNPSDDRSRLRELGARGMHDHETFMAAEGLSTLLKLPNTSELHDGYEYVGGWIKLLYGKYFHLLGLPERSEWLIEQAMRDCIAVLDPSLFVRAHAHLNPMEVRR